MNVGHDMKNVRIELSTSQEDWELIRECYVQSFHRYPLYKYMIPDDNKRDAFLRAYLDANYDVTVATGQGILLAIRHISADVNNNDITTESECPTNCSNNDDTSNNNNTNKKIGTTIIGGVVFVPPSRDGHGWAITDDEPYWEAYEKHGLAKISAEGFERVKRYEAWENENICRKLSGSRIPMWNGLFCAISPEYSSKGLGSAVYKEAIRIMAQYWVNKNQTIMTDVPVNLVRRAGKQLRKVSETDHSRRCFNITDCFFRCNKISSAPDTNHNSLHDVTSGDVNMTSSVSLLPPSSYPLLVAVSHSDRAARFHEANGFHPIARTPYHDKVEGTSPFYTHVLVLDPFRTRKVKFLSSCLQEL
ncbi:uncharacterized protein LOC108950278 [Ciona intestinalis]